MSTGIISATKFFNENGLFKLLEHKDDEMKKSYKTKNILWNAQNAVSKLNSAVMLNLHVAIASVGFLLPLRTMKLSGRLVNPLDRLRRMQRKPC
jgi:hypothetical protein